MKTNWFHPLMLSPWHIAAHAGGAALCAAAAYGTFAPGSQFWGRVIVRGPAGGTGDGGPPGPPGPPAVALTFDDGPTPGPTDRVLDALAAAGARATFFVIGRSCVRWPELVRRMHADGHLVANHSHDHSHAGVFRAQRYWDRQLRDADAAIFDAAGLRPALFRPPMGYKHFHVMRAAGKRGQTVVNWARRARDGVATTPAAILARLSGAEPGDILLLHDGVEPNARTRDRAPTIAALPTLIAGLADRGFALRRVDELVGIAGYLGGSPERVGG